MLLSALVIFSIKACALADELTYSDNLDDVAGIENPIKTIGDLGKIEIIIDLRGFIPYSAVSKEKKARQNDTLITAFTLDVYQVYKLPTLLGVGMFYYGKKEGGSLDKMTDTRFLTDDGSLQGEDRQWASFSHELSKSSGQDLFKSAGGTWGFECAEPICILLTQRSALVFISFRYSDLSRTGTGQIMCAYEFSRSLKEFKAFYDLYSTTAFSRSTRNAFQVSAPYIEKLLPLLSGQ